MPLFQNYIKTYLSWNPSELEKLKVAFSYYLNDNYLTNMYKK